MTVTIGSSHHSLGDRHSHDYYATDPRAGKMLLTLEPFSNDIWEPACGEGHLSKVLTEAGYNVRSSDLIDRGFGIGGFDFLDITNQDWAGDIITNPPYIYANEFVYKALSIVSEGSKVALFLKVQFMEGKARKVLFQKAPPHTIWVSSSRINCAKNGDFTGLRTSGGSAIAYAWWIWVKGFKGTTQLKWFN